MTCSVKLCILLGKVIESDSLLLHLPLILLILVAIVPVAAVVVLFVDRLTVLIITHNYVKVHVIILLIMLFQWREL